MYLSMRFRALIFHGMAATSKISIPICAVFLLQSQRTMHKWTEQHTHIKITLQKQEKAIC